VFSQPKNENKNKKKHIIISTPGWFIRFDGAQLATHVRVNADG
jgi:hypothetical protein